MRRVTGSTFYVAGTFIQGTVMIQPAGYIQGLAQGLSGMADIFKVRQWSQSKADLNTSSARRRAKSGRRALF
jgi:hypothetical protein